MKTLTLPLKKQWFDLIKAGIKKEEYRETSAYWTSRLLKDCLVLTLGYPKADDTERRLEFKNPKIRIGTGRPEWGAEPGKLYFVITWEE